MAFEESLEQLVDEIVDFWLESTPADEVVEVVDFLFESSLVDKTMVVAAYVTVDAAANVTTGNLCSVIMARVWFD